MNRFYWVYLIGFVIQFIFGCSLLLNDKAYRNKQDNLMTVVGSAAVWPFVWCLMIYCLAELAITKIKR